VGGAEKVEFEPIILRYDGLEAANHQLDLAQLGHSLQGAAQLLGTAASIVATGEYAKRALTMPVRIMAGVPRDGSWEIPAIIVSVLPVIAQHQLFVELSKQLAASATTKIVNFAISRFRPTIDKPGDTALALATVEKAMAEAGQTSRHAIDAVVRMAEHQRTPIRQLVFPVGLSCETLMVGNRENGAIPIDRALRDVIDAPDDVEVFPSKHYEIMISEMDRVNRTCKFAFRGEEESDRRVTGEITDPIIQMPSDPYSAAFSEQRWITVVGKLQVRAGEADRLFISDIVR
jgi:hypothetical protein